MQPHRRRLTTAGWKAALVSLLLVLLAVPPSP
jgi:hypothetical protein